MKGIQQTVQGVVMVAAAALLAACADRGVVAPRDGAAAHASAALTASLNLGDVMTTTFTVLPGSATTAVMGEHRLRIPAGAVCDPALSSYGPTEWDKPCQPLLVPLVITARSTRTAAGHPAIDFQPALRFRPTDRGVVTLYMMDKVASADPSYEILFCTARKCVDESLTDPSVATHHDASNGYAYRQLKHFSGYVITPRMSADLSAEELF